MVTLPCVERNRGADATEVVLAGVVMALTALLAWTGPLGALTDVTGDDGTVALAAIELLECNEVVEFKIGREATGAVALVFIKDAAVAVESIELAKLEYGVVFASPKGAGLFVE